MESMGIMMDDESARAIEKLQKNFPSDFSPISRETNEEAYDAIVAKKIELGLPIEDKKLKVNFDDVINASTKLTLNKIKMFGSDEEEIEEKEEVKTVENKVEDVYKELLDKTIDDQIPASLMEKLTINSTAAIKEYEAQQESVKNVLNTPSEKIAGTPITEEDKKGEFKTVMVDVNPATGERNIRPDDIKEENVSFDEVLEMENDKLSEAPLDEEAFAKAIKTKHHELSETEALILSNIASSYRNKQITLTKAYTILPTVFKTEIDKQIAEAGVPANNIAAYRKYAVKGLLDEIIEFTEIEQSAIDIDKQIANIYAQYGDDVTLLYQSNVFEKIKNLEKTVEDFKKDNEDHHLDQKIEIAQCMVDSMYQSYELFDFGEFAIEAKIKNYDRETYEKIFKDFNSKFDNSRYIIQDINLAVEPLKRFCGFSDNEAIDYLLLFCKYCLNKQPSNHKDAVFMCYFVSNIVTLTTNSIPKEESMDKFTLTLVHNIKNIMKLRNDYIQSGKTKKCVYIPEIIDNEYMEEVIKKTEERVKEIEEENKKLDEELGNEEETEEATEETE